MAEQLAREQSQAVAELLKYCRETGCDLVLRGIPDRADRCMWIAMLERSVTGRAVDWTSERKQTPGAALVALARQLAKPRVSCWEGRE